MSQDWYVRRGSHEQGPYTPQELKELADSGNLTHSALVRTTLQPEWRQAGTVKGLFSGNAQEQPAPPPISPGLSDVPVSKVDEPSKADEPSAEKKRSGLDELLSTAKQAKGLAAAYAARAQITRFALPRVYQTLGKEIFDSGKWPDDLNDIVQKIISVDQGITQIVVQAEQRPKATEWKGKLKSGTASVMDRGRVLKLTMRRGRLLQELGSKAFQGQRGQAGSEGTVSSITMLMDKLTSLDEQISQLSNGSDGPLWQRIPVAVLLTVFLIPVGLLLVWLNPHLSRRQKGLWTATSLSLFLVAAFMFTQTRIGERTATAKSIQPMMTDAKSLRSNAKVEPAKTTIKNSNSSPPSNERKLAKADQQTKSSHDTGQTRNEIRPSVLLADEMNSAGFSINTKAGISKFSLESFVRFGSASNAEKYRRGDQFDRLDVERTAKSHRASLFQKRFRISGLRYAVPRRNDVETKGLVLNVKLPLRVEMESDDSRFFDGALCELHGSEVNTSEFWFLTKDNSLRKCSPIEAKTVSDNHGVLYHPESPETDLVLVLQDEIGHLKNVARGAAGHSIEVEIDHVTYDSPNTWGFFRSDKLDLFDWDCHLIRTGGRTGVFGLGDDDQPNYWVTGMNDSLAEGSRKIPTFAKANLFSLKIVGPDGTLVGAYSSLGFKKNGPIVRPKSNLPR